MENCKLANFQSFKSLTFWTNTYWGLRKLLKDQKEEERGEQDRAADEGRGGVEGEEWAEEGEGRVQEGAELGEGAVQEGAEEGEGREK